MTVEPSGTATTVATSKRHATTSLPARIERSRAPARPRLGDVGAALLVGSGCRRRLRHPDHLRGWVRADGVGVHEHTRPRPHRTTDGSCSRGAIPQIYPGSAAAGRSCNTRSATKVSTRTSNSPRSTTCSSTAAYEGNDMIADAAATVVRIRIDGEEYVHSAYALGFDDETDPDRAELQDVRRASARPGGARRRRTSVRRSRSRRTRSS